jgi:hypothetical protein
MVDSNAKVKLLEMFSRATDGSLPEITVNFADNEQRQKTVLFLVDSAKVNQDRTLWSEELQKDVECRDFSKQAFIKMLATDHHIQLHGLFNLPEIGLGIFDGCLTLDFRTGKDWNKKSINSLVELLSDLKNRFNATSVTLDDDGLFFFDQEIEFFKACFNQNS